MTTKKKLITIGVAASILTSLFVWNPWGIRNLASNMIDGIGNPEIDHQFKFKDVYGNGTANRANFDSPRDVEIYGDRLFVVDWKNHRIKVIDKTTEETIRVIGKKDAAPYYSSAQGEFHTPSGIALDKKNGFFYVADAGNNRIQKFRLDNYAFVAAFGTNGTGPKNFKRPRAIALDVENNRLYVADSYNCRIQRFELSTLEFRDEWGSCGTGNNQFRRYDDGESGPEGIAVDEAGDVYVSDTWNDRIQKFDFNGNFIKTILTSGTTNGKISRPRDLEFDTAGYLYVADSNNDRIQKIDLRPSAPSFVSKVGTNGVNNSQFKTPRGITIDSNGVLYVTDTNNHRIQSFRQHIITPTEPTNLRAVPGVTEVDLAWGPATTRTGGSRLTDYIIQYKKTTDTDWSRFADGVSLDTQATVAPLTGNAAEYQFRVLAKNYSGELSDPSNTVTVRLLSDTAPSAPKNLIARVANGQINLSWSAASTNSGPAIKDYKVQFRIKAKNPENWTTFDAGTVSINTSVEVTGLTNDVEYEFRVMAQNTAGAWGPSSAIVSRAPNEDDQCNNINGVQENVPTNTKRVSKDCVCVNEGIVDTSANTATVQACPLSCPARSMPIEPEFMIEYNEGFPKIYDNIDDTVGQPAAAKKLILSAGETIVDTGAWTSLFKTNGQPFYDPDILLEKPQLSLQREGNKLKVLLYGHRTDNKIEHVRGKLYIRGGANTRWTGVTDISMDITGKGANSTSTDFAEPVEGNPSVIRFDLAVSADNDVFVGRYDLGTAGCMEKPLIIFDKNATDATGAMADKLVTVGVATALPTNTFERAGYTFTGWNTKADGEGTSYGNGASYTMTAAKNVTLYATWTAAVSTYTITYNANGATGGAIPAAQTKTHGTDLTLATNSGTLARTGYMFAGWNTAADGSGTSYTAGATYTANAAVTLYAKWTTVTTDTTPPATPSLAPSVTGGTTDGLPTVTVQCTEVGSTITLYNGATVLATKACTAVGATTITFTTALTNGTYSITYSEKDAATPPNESGKSPSYTLVVNRIAANAPTVVNVTSSIANGSYRAGTVIPILVTFSEPVIVTGIPTIALETYNDRIVGEYTPVNYSGGSETETLTFNYTVIPVDTASDLNYATVNSLKLKDSTVTIKSASTNVAANLALPALNDASKSLAGNKNIIIDTNRPLAPARPIVPQQSNVTLSSTATNTFIATGSSVKVTVACTVGEKISIRDGVSFLPVTTANCTTNPVEITLNLASPAGYYNFFATSTDVAGNESDYSPRIAILKQQTTSDAPSAPDLDSLDDLGISSTDNLTSVTRPRFFVSCIAGYTVNLYDGGTNLIGTAPCMAGTAQILSVQSLSAGTHTISAKQSNTSTTSASSGNISVTIDTEVLSVSIARAPEQTNPATNAAIKFIATFNRAIDTNSFVCSDVTVVNGSCTGITTLTSSTAQINISATAQGTVKATIYAGRVQTAAGNLNTESTGTNTVTYGAVSASAECSDLRRFTISDIRTSSLDYGNLCKKGSPSSVSYSSSRMKWTYQCRGSDGASVSCTVSAILDSAPTCEAQELPFDECRLTNTSNLYYFYEYLDCLGVAEKSSCNKSYGCPQEAKRQELVYIADQLRGIPLDADNYECQGNHTDTERSGVASWVCEAAEKAQVAELISTTNTKFRPLDTMTRAEAYSVLMKSVCVHPETDYRNWQTKVAKEAKDLGFTVRTVSQFEPNKLILRQELYALAARIAEYKEENPDACDDLPDELICE